MLQHCVFELLAQKHQKLSMDFHRITIQKDNDLRDVNCT
jgi:hypothetical protein